MPQTHECEHFVKQLQPDPISQLQPDPISLSMRLETSQSNSFLTSGFSEEDLPSDLIAFYMSVEGFKKRAIKNICKGIGRTESLILWDATYGKKVASEKIILLPQSITEVVRSVKQKMKFGPRC